MLNVDTAPEILGVIQRQLFITSTLSASQFDGYVAADGYWPVANVYAAQTRVLVLRDYTDHTNRSLFDLVLWQKNGLLTIECNRNGPHGSTYSVDRCYLTQLIAGSRFPCPWDRCCQYGCQSAYYALFPKYRTSNNDFNPRHLDPCPPIEPYDA